MSTNGVYGRHGMLHSVPLVLSKSNIEFNALVAAILDYVNNIITLPHLKGNDHIGFLCQFNLHAGFKIAFLYTLTVTLY